MKQILAVIRSQAINRTREALVSAGVSGFTVRKVLGRGKGKVDFRVLQGAEEGQTEAIPQPGEGPMLFPKRLLTVVVSDERVAAVVQTIIDANRTSTAGDGKIFVLPVSEAVRIRTSESGAKALE
ncbi:MAG: P-II family nitrogen regulator [Vulcanimicrobiaceae bacterium]